MSLAEKANAGTPIDEYLVDLTTLLSSKFKRSCKIPEGRSVERQRVIVRYVVHMHILMMDRGLTKNKTALLKHRNPETPIEASMRTAREQPQGPSAAVISSLNSAKSFRITPAAATPSPTSTTATNIHANRSACTSTNRPSNTPPSTILPLPPDAKTSTFWVNTRVATMEETRAIHHRLILRAEYCDIAIHHHPLEIYIAWCLHKTRHVYENLGRQQHLIDNRPLQHQGSSVYVISDGGMTERFPDVCMVARPGSTIFDESFPESAYAFPMENLLAFLIRHGESDPSRSNGWRVDLSNAGQAQDTTAEEFRPRVLCGDDIFYSDLEGELVRAIIGKIVDGICRAIKRMSRAMGKPHTLNMKRYTEYAQKLQEFLYAQESFVENVTLQLLDLTAGHSGVEHEDTSNDMRASYDSTAAKVFNLVDARGHLISLKVVCSFRKKLGDFFSVKMSIVNSLLVNIRTMLEGVNASYRRLVSHHRGSHTPVRVPTWDDIEELFLDHDSPWESKLIAGNIIQ
jgi:hypothetical protein